MKIVATPVLIAAACFLVIAEAQQLPKIPVPPGGLTEQPPPFSFDPFETKPPRVTQTTLKPTTACTCGPTTLTSFTTSTLKTSSSKPTTTLKTTGRTIPTRPTNGTTSRTTTTLKTTGRTIPTRPTNGTTSRPTTTLKTTGRTIPTKPTNGTTSRTTTTLKTTGRTIPTKPTSPTTTPNPVDRTCLKLEANSETYYKLCNPPGTHTLNLFSSSIWGADCQPGYPAASVVSATDITTILKVHNKYRQIVSQGLETQGSPAGPQPMASNMRELKWDDELACIAAAWAHQCVYKHDQCRDVSRFQVGQNIYIAASSADTLGISNWNSAVTAWYNEVQFMDPLDVSSFPASPPNVIGHYTQVVWADTYLVGCATAYYQSTAVFGPKMPYNRIYVCNYGPAGNWIDSPVYAQGSPGSACPTVPSITYTGLCA